MKLNIKRNLSAAIFGFMSFAIVSLIIFFDDAPLPDTKIQFLTVTISLSFLFALSIGYLLLKKTN